MGRASQSAKSAILILVPRLTTLRVLREFPSKMLTTVPVRPSQRTLKWTWTNHTDAGTIISSEFSIIIQFSSESEDTESDRDTGKNLLGHSCPPLYLNGCTDMLSYSGVDKKTNNPTSNPARVPLKTKPHGATTPHVFGPPPEGAEENNVAQ